MYIDGHCDSLEVALNENRKLFDRNLEFNLTYAKKNTPCIQICAAFVDSKYRNGFERACEILNIYIRNNENTIFIKNNKEIKTVLEKKKIGILISIENASAINDNLENVDLLYNMGVRMMGITWNDDNLIGCGAHTKNDIGLTDFGKKYILKLDQKNIIIDVSHCSKKTFWDTIKYSKNIVVASHSCCNSICNNSRNLDDDQIVEIANRNGIIGICLCSKFLTTNLNSNVNDVIKHIIHIINLVGDDFVGLGSDFDGVKKEHKLVDIKGIKDIWILKKELKNYGFSEKTIKKIMGENWLRVIKEKLK